MLKPETVEEALSSMLVVWNIFAFKPISTNKNTINSKKIDIVDIFKLLLVSVLIIFTAVTRSEQYIVNYYTFHFSCLIITPALIIINLLIQRGTIANVFQQLKKIDSEFYEWNLTVSNVNLRKINIVQSFLFVILLLISISSFVISGIYFRPYQGLHFVNYIIYSLPFILISSLMIWQFCDLVYCIWIRFELLNATIWSFIFKNQQEKIVNSIFLQSNASISLVKTFHHGQKESTFVHLRRISYIHDQLCEASLMLNAAFNIPLLTFVGVLLVDAINATYHLIGHIELSLEQLPSNFINLFNLIFLVYVCTASINEAKLSGRIVHLCRDNYSNNNSEFHFWVDDFALQILHHKIQFTAWGFFQIDYTLALSILGTTVMFMIYVVQFQTAAELQKKPTTSSA